MNELNRSIVDFRIRTRIATEEELTNARQVVVVTRQTEASVLIFEGRTLREAP